MLGGKQQSLSDLSRRRADIRGIPALVDRGKIVQQRMLLARKKRDTRLEKVR